ncbi:MAG TPA: DegT/DnrJ/EryC1/StrS aminotransferase, partial [Armatimonadetes bacterium]|nr:DegT/DnrJ/EryC1/StrS aminotransferase [Armatimonadota bacterium]
DDSEVADRIRQYRSFGLGKGWGTNYKMTKVQAAVGLVQLRRLDEMNALRRKRALQRTELLKDVPELTLPYEPPGYLHAYYLYNILVPCEWAGEKRNRLMQILADEYRIGCVVANPPTYKSNKLIREHTAGQEVSLAEEIGERLFCPCLHPLMSEEDNEYVAAAIIEAVERLREA